MTLPKENLDNKAFGDLLKEAISRIPVYAPEWTDHNVHDPGITFIELFAWLTEIQIYRLNRINDKSYRKFLKLMGIPKLKPATAAKVDVTFFLRDNVNDAVVVPKETIIAATDSVSGEDLLFETEQDLNVLRTELIIQSYTAKNYTNNTKANLNDNVYFYAFGPEKPEEDDGLFIGFKENPGKKIDLVFYIKDDEPLGKDASSVVPWGTLEWKYWAATGNWEKINKKEIEDDTANFSVNGMVRIKLAYEMIEKDVNGEEGYWLRCCCVADEKRYQIPPKIDCVHLNTVPATHAVQRNNPDDNTFSSSGLPDFSISLKYTPVLDKKLTVNVNEPWIRVEDFDASKPGDKHYTVDLASGTVTFGNGINGKIPPKGEHNITVSYYSGGGVRGNVRAGSIQKVLCKDLIDKVTVYSGGGVRGNVRAGSIQKVLCKDLIDKVTVNNLKAASGGEEAETLEEAIQRARKELKEVTRAVTSTDYENLALNTPGVKVARAKALPRYHPKQDREVPGIISVIVVQSEPKKISCTDFLKAVYWHLEEYRLLTTELFVLLPVYVDISIEAEVIVKPKSYPDTVQNEVKDKLKEFLHPCSGGFDGKGWPFGRSVYLSEVYKLIDRVDGVNYVKSVTLGGKEGISGVKYVKSKSSCLEPQIVKIDIPAEGLLALEPQLKITAREEA